MDKVDTKFSKHLINEHEPIMAALERLNEQSHADQFMIVVNTSGRLKGTLTDGDIRRNLLSGQSLDGPVSNFMHKKPVFGNITDSNRDLDALLIGISSAHPFIPLVNENKIVVSVKLSRPIDNSGFNALLLAGGFGKRLGERTRAHPKPLLELQGKPLLEHVLSRLEKTSVNHIFIAVHYLSEQIEAFIERTSRKDKVTLLYEDTPLGTAGAISLLPELTESNLIVSNTDILTNMDYFNLFDFHQSNQFDATLAVANHSIQIPFGVVRHDLNGNFIHIDEKPIISNYVSAGMYCLNHKFLSLVEREEYLDMPSLITKGRQKELDVGVFPIHEDWHDIGRPEDFEKYN